MKFLLYGLLPFALSVHAQQSTNSQFILRSTLGMSSVHSDQPPQHILQQSTGQSSVIGTYAAGDHMLHQGFVQASVWQNMALTGEEIDLKAKTYPNPETICEGYGGQDLNDWRLPTEIEIKEFILSDIDPSLIIDPPPTILFSGVVHYWTSTIPYYNARTIVNKTNGNGVNLSFEWLNEKFAVRPIRDTTFE